MSFYAQRRGFLLFSPGTVRAVLVLDYLEMRSSSVNAVQEFRLILKLKQDFEWNFKKKIKAEHDCSSQQTLHCAGKYSISLLWLFI